MVKNIVILHGWALKLSPAWKPLVNDLKKAGFRVYLPLIPGLTGPRLMKPWTLDSYCSWLKDYLIAKKITNFLLIGHSFGGSICLKYALAEPEILPGLVLINSSGIRQKTVRVKLLYSFSKTIKILFLIYPLCLVRDFVRKTWYKMIRSADYLQTKGALTETFRNIINEDLSVYLEKITTRVLLIWGTADKYTPIAEGKIMAQKIPNAKLVIFKNGTHGLPFQKRKEVVSEIIGFIKTI